MSDNNSTILYSAPQIRIVKVDIQPIMQTSNPPGEEDLY